MNNYSRFQGESLQDANIWKDDEPLECVSVVPEAPDTASFSFRARSGASFAYKAGQFLTLKIPHPDGVIYRTYTISSSPTRPRLLTITAKAQSNSQGTRWLLDHLKPGMQLDAVGPAGTFTNAESTADKFLFLSAGSGITPMMSMLTAMWDEGRTLDVNLISCAHRPSDIIFKQRLEYMTGRAEGLDVKFIVSQPDKAQPWTGYQGRLNREILQLVAPDLLQREIYCCGPQEFMLSVKEMLVNLGYDMTRYHEESFSGATEEPGSEVLANDPPADTVSDTSHEVCFTQSERTHLCEPTETVLAAARSAGLVIPSGCQFGVCGTCKVKKIQGDVEMTHNGGISEVDIESGYILACCSRPLGKVLIEA